MNRSKSIEATVEVDVEQGDHEQLENVDIHQYAWNSCTVHVKDRKTKQHRAILQKVSGIAKAGEVVAILGPSGSGKTTLLNQLAHRAPGGGLEGVTGALLLNGEEPTLRSFRNVSSYVEQEDVLIGSLTVAETLDFAARLAPSSLPSNSARRSLVSRLISAFGLESCADTIVGTPIRKGISGGQKRRLSVASQLITGPKMLFLDEPTSGLDSSASYETMSFIKSAARTFNASWPANREHRLPYAD